jgi:phosphoglycerate-specific signal transduction histidine kinase
MTRFLASDSNPEGFRMEDILTALRTDLIKRCERIAEDHRPEAHHVLENNIRILGLLTEAIQLAEESTRHLQKSFGPSKVSEGGAPRIGKED